MNKSFAVLAAVFLIALAGLASAEDTKKEASPAQKAHRERMSACSKDAKQQGLKGDERKAFMRQCLSSDASAAGQEGDSRRSQAAACRKEARAKALKGDERKKFVSECVGNQTSAAQ